MSSSTRVKINELRAMIDSGEDKKCWQEIIKQSDDFFDIFLKSNYVDIESLTREKKERLAFALAKSKAYQCIGFYSDSFLECTKQCLAKEKCILAAKELLEKDPFERVDASSTPAKTETKVISMTDETDEDDLDDEDEDEDKDDVEETTTIATAEESESIVEDEDKNGIVNPHDKNGKKQQKYNWIVFESFKDNIGSSIEKEVLMKICYDSYKKNFNEEYPLKEFKVASSFTKNVVLKKSNIVFDVIEDNIKIYLS